MSQKRNRSLNWDEEEKQLLRSVLQDYAKIIENKSLDTITNKNKTKAWEEVHRKFNELNNRFRQLSQLKVQWKIMKVNARKTYGTFKRELYKTGGGVRPKTPDDSIIEVKDLLNPAELLPDHNWYDSDGMQIDNIQISQDNAGEATPSEICIDKLPAEYLQITTYNSGEATPTENSIDKLPVKITQGNPGEATQTEISINKLPVKPPKPKIMHPNKGSKSTKDRIDYATSMVRHSKMLKDEEHLRRMEMANEEHAIKIQILQNELETQREKLKTAKLEREIFELKKAREIINT